MHYLAGIDVSHWQGSIDWSRVRPGGTVDFVYIKATDGQSGVDPKFNANWLGAKTAKLPRGAYHFWRQVDVGGQVRSLLATLGEDAGELPPALDVEVGPLDRPEWDAVLAWLQAVEQALKVPPVLYLDLAAVRKLDGVGFRLPRGEAEWLQQFTHYPLWLADYSGGAEPLGAPPWPDWMFWQHTPQGSTPGLAGAVDLDYFQGSPLELAALKTARVDT